MEHAESETFQHGEKNVLPIRWADNNVSLPT